MKKGDYQKKNGFTIIEVSLVLAVAGLIFLMVFVALPQLQRQQRDSRRRDDILSFLETVKKYQTNNRGALPGGSDHVIVAWDEAFYHGRPLDETSWFGLYMNYLGDNFMDPDGSRYKLEVMKCKSNVNEACGGDYGSSEMRTLQQLYAASFPNDHTIVVITGATCNGDAPVGVSNPRKVAALYRMEGAGVYCANT